MANDVVGYLVTWTDQWRKPNAAIVFDDYQASVLCGIKSYDHIHLYKSVNGALTEIELSEGNNE